MADGEGFAGRDGFVADGNDMDLRGGCQVRELRLSCRWSGGVEAGVQRWVLM